MPELFESTVIADYLLWSMNFLLTAESGGTAPFAPVAAATAVTRLVFRPPRVKLPPGPPRGFLDLDPLISGGRYVTTDSLRFDLNRLAICS